MSMVTSETDWNEAVAAARDRFGRLDILVNNAGLFLGKDIEAASLAEWERLCSGQPDRRLSRHQAVPAGAARGGAAERPRQRHRQPGLDRRPGRFDAGPALFDDQGRRDPVHQIRRPRIRPRKGYRVRVNSVHPGTIDTDMGDQVLSTRARNLGTNDIEAARRQVIERLPIGRMGTPNDIAKGILFLASDDAAFMTGSALVVDGGITAQ